jgi:hypothetical protein
MLRPLFQDDALWFFVASWAKEPRIILHDDFNEYDNPKATFFQDWRRQKDKRQILKSDLMAHRFQISSCLLSLVMGLLLQAPSIVCNS